MTPFEVRQESVNFTAKTLWHCFLWNSQRYSPTINVSVSASHVSLLLQNYIIMLSLFLFACPLTQFGQKYVYICLYSPWAIFQHLDKASYFQ